MTAAANEAGKFLDDGVDEISARPADERTALLFAPQTDADEEDQPLPMGQMLLLCWARFVEPIAFFSIFPYIAQMINESGGVPEEDVGFWAGLIESMFSLTQTICMLGWGRASDRYGRKPVLIASLAGATIATALFGVASSVWQMIALRCLAGIFAGSVVTVRTMITENSTQRTQARAFSYFAFSGNLAIFCGPLIGGVLAKPVEQYPWAFKGNRLFTAYPYLLPCFGAAMVAGSAALVNLLWLKETRQVGKEHDAVLIEPPTIKEVLQAPGVARVLLIYQWVFIIGGAWTAVLPVFCWTSISLGGYSFSPSEVALYLTASGLGQSIWLLLLFPPLTNRLGTGRLLRICAAFWPLVFVMMASLNLLLRAGLYTAFWVILPFGIFFYSGCSMAYTGVQLALNNISPSPLALGTLNGLALSLQSAFRSIAPAGYTALYALGVKHHILGGELGWAAVSLTCVVLVVLLRFLPEKAEGRRKPKAIEQERA